MIFFENELRKILMPQYPETTFVGRAAYIRLSDTNRAKIQFVSPVAILMDLPNG